MVCLAVFTTLSAQHRNSHKLRATAVVEVTTDPHGVVTTRLVPVTVLDEKHFQDASVYKASPRPMALENGLVYEAQKTGTPVGYVTILNGANSGGWVAMGRFNPVSATAKTDATPKPVTSGDDRPILHHGDSSNSGATSSSPTATPTSTPADSNSDRPVLHHGDSSTSATPPSPVATPTPAQASPSPTPPEAQEDPSRPLLQHRAPGQKPQGPQPDAVPTPTPAQPTKGNAPSAKSPAGAGVTQTYVAVSDEQPIDTRSFNFSWKPGEEQEVGVKMRKLALAQLQRESPRLTDSSLSNVVFRSFDLDLTNDAALVISAEASVSSPAGAKETQGKSIVRYVTVIARLDFDGIPQKLMVNLTDSSRLDVVPRMELVDAVDVDGAGPAELLFREYSFDHKSFVIYTVGRNVATKIFEGSSQSIRPGN